MILRTNVMTDDQPGPGGDPEQLADQSLLRRVRDGNDDAATALYTRYAERLMKLANRQVYDDVALQVDREGIVQSVFRTFFRRASLGQYDVVDGDGLWKLLLVIALNKIRTAGTHHRAARRSASRTRSLSENDRTRDVPLSSGEQALVHLQMTIDELLDSLPEDHRTIIRLRIDGHDIAEIASRSGRAKRTVERVLQRFRERLEKICKEETS